MRVRVTLIITRGRERVVVVARVANGSLWWPHLCAVLVETVEHHDHVKTLQCGFGDLQVLARQRTGG